MRESRKPLWGHAAALLTMGLWASTYASTKVVLEAFSPTEILFFRFAAAYLALCLTSRKALPWQGWRGESIFAGMGFFGVTLYYLAQNYALEFTSASNVGVLISTTVIFTAIANRIFFREKALTPRFWLGALLATVGVCLISFNGVRLRLNPVGDLLTLLAAVSWALYGCCLRRAERQELPPLLLVRRTFFYGLLFLLPFLPFLEFRLGWKRFAEGKYTGNLLFLALGASLLAYILWNRAVGILGVVHTTVYVYLDPVLSVLISVLWLGEPVTAMLLAGIAAILAGMALAGKKGKAAPE